MNLKQELYNRCELFINDRLETVLKKIEELQKALLTETKSSAGDKHETGRAMVQLEREKAGRQLAEINKVKEVFNKVKIEKHSNKVTLGTLVYTTQANYFIAISVGEIVINKAHFFAISANTPMGKILLSKTAGDIINFNNQTIEIKKII